MNAIWMISTLVVQQSARHFLERYSAQQNAPILHQGHVGVGTKPLQHLWASCISVQLVPWDEVHSQVVFVYLWAGIYPPLLERSSLLLHQVSDQSLLEYSSSLWDWYQCVTLHHLQRLLNHYWLSSGVVCHTQPNCSWGRWCESQLVRTRDLWGTPSQPNVASCIDDGSTGLPAHQPAWGNVFAEGEGFALAQHTPPQCQDQNLPFLFLQICSSLANDPAVWQHEVNG